MSWGLVGYKKIKQKNNIMKKIKKKFKSDAIKRPVTVKYDLHAGGTGWV